MLEENDRRTRAMRGLLGAGLTSELSTATVVEALARARRSVAEAQGRASIIEGWLREEIKLRGVRENAAVLVALEDADAPAWVEREYRERYPDRQAALDQWMAEIRT